MVRVQYIYAAIDFAPILVLLSVHCSSGRWPTDAECVERVTRYGFSVDTFSERPASVLTHLFVHISSRHLLSNVFSFAATLAEFGDVAATVAGGAVARRWWASARDDEAPRVSGRTVGGSASRRLGSRMRTVFGQGSCLQACVHSAGAFFVWAVGGAVGGLSSQILYNNLMVALRRRCAARAAAAAADATRKAGAVAADGRILESLSRVAESIRQRVEACNSNLAVSAQEAVNNVMLMCGASAGICALSGFSTAYYGRYVTAWCLVVPDALLLATDLVNRYVALLAPKIGALDCVAEAERRALKSTWRILMPAQTIGHAAHVGGFVMGLGMGYGWRYTTVLHSMAARYFAVAPKSEYDNALLYALLSDVRQMISTNGGNDACCDAIELHAGAVQRNDKAAEHASLETGGAAPASPSSHPQCVCMVGIDVKDIRRHFYGNLEFLGITFDVDMHIWGPSSTPALAAPADAMRAASKTAQASAAAVGSTVAAAADLRPAALNCLARDPSHHGVSLSLLGMDRHTGTPRTGTHGALDAMSCSAADRQQVRQRTAVATTPSSNTSFAPFDVPEGKPAMPFAWSLPRNDAFPYIRASVLKKLTRKSYLSAYKRDVYVFADLTLDDLLRMLSMELSPVRDNSAGAQAGSSTGAAVSEGAPAARVAQGDARSTAGLQEVSGTDREHYCYLLVTPEATLIRPPEEVYQSTPRTTDGTASYPPVLVKVVQDAYNDFSSGYTSITSIMSTFCMLVVITLPVCAALAYVHQVWRRRREKRADMRRLLQHDLR